MSFIATKPPFAVYAVGKPASILANGGFFYLKFFYSHQQSWWFFCA
jgi:hypothetical protein